MIQHPDTDLLARYKSAQEKLVSDPNDRASQHLAVLCLARLGATDLALKAYSDYGLTEVQNDEDILALKGRLYKDKYLKAASGEAQEFGKLSARSYRLAYEKTGGYYSAINAATLSFLTGSEPESVRQEAADILTALPAIQDTSSDERYFVAATRAEAHLLRGDLDRAEHALSRAMSHDPLNYIAHAATLKQLNLISAKQENEFEWLSALTPPRPAFFTGHIWSQIDAALENNLRIELSDAIQKKDIGFAYSALAAGADILFAEVCRDEGVSLHIILPTDIQSFLDQSVRPSGEMWEPRFFECLEAASSVQTLPVLLENAGDGALELAAEIAMGQTIQRSHDFTRRPVHLSIMSPERPGSFTHHIHKKWTETGFDSLVLPIDLPSSKSVWTCSESYPVVINSSDAERRVELDEVLSTLVNMRAASSDIHLFADIEFAGIERKRDENLKTSLPGTTLLSQSLASVLISRHPDRNLLTYAGLDQSGEHLYSLNEASLTP